MCGCRFETGFGVGTPRGIEYRPCGLKFFAYARDIARGAPSLEELIGLDSVGALLVRVDLADAARWQAQCFETTPKPARVATSRALSFKVRLVPGAELFGVGLPSFGSGDASLFARGIGVSVTPPFRCAPCLLGGALRVTLSKPALVLGDLFRVIAPNRRPRSR